MTTSKPSTIDHQASEARTAQRRLRNLRGIAEKRGELFKLDALPPVPKRCPILGVPLVRVVGAKGGGPASPTATRLRSELGWVPGNVRIVSGRAGDLLNHANIASIAGRLERYDTPEATAARQRQQRAGQTPASLCELRAVRDWLRDVNEGRA